MITENAVSGGTSFPLVGGPTTSSLRDPVARGLAEYFAHWLNASLNGQLAQMDPKVAEAVPSSNVHAYNPQGFWVRSPTPALYVYWLRDTQREYSTLRNMTVNVYGLLYVHDEIVGPDGQEHFEGFPAQAARVMRVAEDRGYHPFFGHNGAELGTPIGTSLGVKWAITRLEAGAMAPVQAVSSAVGGDAEGGILRYFPAVQGEIEVLDAIGQQQPRDPEDVLVNLTADLRTNEAGDTTNVVSLMERILPAPDGSEQEQ